VFVMCVGSIRLFSGLIRNNRTGILQLGPTLTTKGDPSWKEA